MENILNWLAEFAKGFTNRFIPFLLIVVVGLIIIKIVMTIIKKALANSKLEKAAHSLIKSVAKTIMITLLCLIAASALGIDVTGVVAIASVVSLALSLAMQNSLTNLIGGFTLLNTHPFQSGDWVEIAGQSGTVKEIGMAYTKLVTADNKLIQIPNSNVIESEIVNYSATGTRRITIDVSVSSNESVDKVLSCLNEAANVDGILEEKGVFAALTGFANRTTNYTVRIWCNTGDYWTINYLVTRRIKDIFERENIQMSYNNIDVHIDK